MLIIRQIDVFKLAQTILNIIQIIGFVYTFAQLQIISQIKMAEFVHLDVLILPLYNMEIKEQENVRSNVHKGLGEITQLIFVYLLVLLDHLLIILLVYALLNVLRMKTFMQICYYTFVHINVQEVILVVKLIKHVFLYVITIIGVILPLLYVLKFAL